MFTPQNACQEFEESLRSRGLHERDLNLADGCEALFDFYRDKRPNGRVFEQHEDADMLLFQWETYDWGTGEQFAFNLTRQLIVCEDAEDEDIWQLSLTFEFETDNEPRALGMGTNGVTPCWSCQNFENTYGDRPHSQPVLSTKSGGRS